VEEVTVDEDLPEQMRIRRAKRDALAASGMDPYPVSLPITHSIDAIRAQYPDLPTDSHTGRSRRNRRPGDLLSKYRQIVFRHIASR
jgi:lysyl-tRNA synthetase class II